MNSAVSGNNLKLLLTPGLNYYFRVKATDTTVASAILPLPLPNRPVAPAYTIDYVNESTSEKIKTIDEYSNKADMSNPFIGVGLRILLIPGQNLYFRTKASNTSFKSFIQTMIVPRRPAAPSNPAVDDVANTFDWTNNPDFTNVADYEYSVDNGLTWQLCSSKPINVGNVDLLQGFVSVRVKVNVDHFSGEVLQSNAAFTLATEINDFKSTDIQVYPNPTHNILLISNLPQGSELTIYSLAGIQMMVFHMNNSNTIDLGSLPNGTYILKVKSSHTISETKFIKQ
jgi:hypothetical protein